jgi:hypothetical protein
MVALAELPATSRFERLIKLLCAAGWCSNEATAR